jgi:cation diffusion facilitator CzcD-associated flavoprotein CzcO
MGAGNSGIQIAKELAPTHQATVALDTRQPALCADSHRPVGTILGHRPSK